jgi:hypothetical protein
LEAGGCEDAAVEADDGDFDGGAEEEVGELVCEEDLHTLVAILQTIVIVAEHTFQ